MSATSVALLLHCIALVESGNNPHAVGARGEVGRHQMMPATARAYSPEGYVREIERMITRRGGHVCPFNVALVWNAGPKALDGRAPTKSYEYARRVQALYHDHKQH